MVVCKSGSLERVVFSVLLNPRLWFILLASCGSQLDIFVFYNSVHVTCLYANKLCCWAPCITTSLIMTTYLSPQTIMLKVINSPWNSKSLTFMSFIFHAKYIILWIEVVFLNIPLLLLIRLIQRIFITTFY